MAVNSAVLQLVAAVSSLTFVLVTGVRGLLGLGPAIFLTASALTSMPAGRMMDRFGRKPVMSFGFVVGAAGCALTALATRTDSTPAVIAGFALIGAASAVSLLIRTAAGDMYPAARRAAAGDRAAAGSHSRDARRVRELRRDGVGDEPVRLRRRRAPSPPSGLGLPDHRCARVRHVCARARDRRDDRPRRENAGARGGTGGDGRFDDRADVGRRRLRDGRAPARARRRLEHLLRRSDGADGRPDEPGGTWAVAGLQRPARGILRRGPRAARRLRARRDRRRGARDRRDRHRRVADRADRTPEHRVCGPGACVKRAHSAVVLVGALLVLVPAAADAGPYAPYRHFVSRPDLRPPRVKMLVRTRYASRGFLFIAPKKKV